MLRALREGPALGRVQIMHSTLCGLSCRAMPEGQEDHTMTTGHAACFGVPSEVLDMANERALRISDELARVLVLYRERMRVPMRPVVSGRALDYVERAVGLDIPDDIIAVFAASGRDLLQIARLTEEAREEHDLPANQLVIADGEDARCQWRAQVEVSKGLVTRTARTEVFYCSVFGKRLRDSVSVAEFERRYLKIYEAGTALEDIGFDAALASFRPGVLKEPTSPRRRVHHRQFGIGTVLCELESGRKLEVRFGTERVILMASFCEDLSAHRVAS